jgi:Flp pilus assembly protein TadG
MPHPSLPLEGRRRRLGFLQDRSGTAAIEFAFVAGPFLFMMFAIIELALVFLLSTSLDAASDGASRRIRTGQFQSAGQTAAQFKTDICSKMTWMAGNCESSLSVDVRTYTLYSQVQPHDPVKVVDGKKTFDNTAIQFAATLPPETIVVVRSYYRWPLITPFLNQALERLDGGVALVSSTQTFQTEPYQ